MADVLKPSLSEKEIDQAITALKKGAYLLKYGRRGKPKFCPFRLSSDETTLIWYYGKDEKQLELRQVSRIIPGQRTAIFQRYPRPEKEYQSFSLIYSDRSLDLICKDKDEAEVWFAGLKALLARYSARKARCETKEDSVSSESQKGQRIFSSGLSQDQGDTARAEGLPRSRLGLAFSDIVTYTATAKSPLPTETATVSISSPFSGATENPNGRISTGDTVRVSLSSAVSSSSQGSCPEDSDGSADVFIFGEGAGGGVLIGGGLRVGESPSCKFNANLPKMVESTMLLDVRNISCGDNYAILVTKQGEVFSWGKEIGGRLGHGVESEVCHPKLIDTLSGMDIQMVSCGKYHSCAITFSGDLYTWGDGIHNCGLLGHGNEVGHWIPRKVCGLIEALQVSYVSCGPWHTALITSAGQLFTFGDGSFGALGHGDCKATNVPREVEALKGKRTLKVACGVWHTAAVVEVMNGTSDSGPSDGRLSGKLFTWGNGDEGQLGHGDTKPRLTPECVALSLEVSFSRVACGHCLTVALASGGQVYTMGSTAHGQLGNPVAHGRTPVCVGGRIADIVVEDIACGSYHVAVLTSTSEVYTWGKGSNGQLGHGDNDDRTTPTVVDFFRNKQVNSVVCGSNFTAVSCIHKWISGAHNSVCSNCQCPFNFRRKRHNCYNCGLIFCNACSSRKSLKASLAPSTNKPYRVCDDCFTKLQKSLDPGSAPRIQKARSENVLPKFRDLTEKEIGGPQLQGNVSRLTSSDSFNLVEGRNTMSSGNIWAKDGHMFLLPNSNRSSASSCKSPTSSSKPYWRLLSAYVPGSRIGSRSTSPILGKTNTTAAARPTLSPESCKDGPIVPDNSDSSDEIKTLRAQVEELTNKTQILEAEVAQKSRQLKETTARAADEAEKAKSAKEVIKSLTAQLKEMAERVPKGHITSTLAGEELLSNDSNRLSSGSSVTSQTSPRSESGDTTIPPMLSNGVKKPIQNSERVIKDKAGVYITLVSAPGGGNELKRVRFSRKTFTEEQAAQWWTENGTKVFQKYNITSAV